MQISTHEASFLHTAMEAMIKKSQSYIDKIESGEIPNADPSTFELSKSFQKERREILSKLMKFCEGGAA